MIDIFDMTDQNFQALLNFISRNQIQTLIFNFKRPLTKLKVFLNLVWNPENFGELTSVKSLKEIRCEIE